MSDSQSSAFEYCASEVRRLDHERFLASLFAPPDARAWLSALYAFNLELAKTAEIVSEPMLGEIRLQWWRDAIDEVYAGSVREHLVLSALAATIETHGLDRAHFDALIDARAQDLDPEPPDTLDSLEGYVRASAVPLVALAAQILAPERPIGAIDDVGMAIGLAGLLRAVPFHAGQRRLYLPRDLLEQAGIGTGMIFDRKPPPDLAEVVSEIARRARRHVELVVAARAQSPKEARAALLPLVPVELYLKRLGAVDHDLFGAGLEPGPLTKQLRMSWCAFTKRYAAGAATSSRQEARSESARTQ